VSETLSTRIAELLRARGIGQRELARRSKLSVSYVNQVVNGQIADPGADKLVALARGLDVDVGELVQGLVDVSEIDRFLSPRLARIQKLGLSPEHEQQLVKLAEAFKALEQQTESQAGEAEAEPAGNGVLENGRPPSPQLRVIAEEREQYKA
jgi:transcriptional regulator with XRE-family HTH domain